MAVRTCTAVVPTYNERDTIARVVRDLMAIPGVRALVVDDASPDGTGDVADSLAAEFPDRVEVLHRPRKSGFASACIDGIRRALEGGSDIIAQIDADLSHDVRYLPQLIAATTRADLAIGSRYVRGGGALAWPVGRRALSRAANLYFRCMTGLRVRDCTAGYRCWRRTALLRLPLSTLTAGGYAIQAETTWLAYRHGLQIAEVPIVMTGRTRGESKLSWPMLYEAIILPWRLRREP